MIQQQQSNQINGFWPQCNLIFFSPLFGYGGPLYDKYLLMILEDDLRNENDILNEDDPKNEDKPKEK